MASVADVYRALNALRDEGVVEQYAICGGTAALFYAETTATFDIDIFVLIEQSGLLVDLSRIYQWARDRGYGIEQEYLIVHGVPVQILVAGGGLETEAVRTANLLDYDGVLVPVVKPEFLVLLYLRAGGAKRRGRAFDLLEAGADRHLVAALAARYDLDALWQQYGGDEP
ncbi:MAG TPA: hypothetical protein VNA16_03885 [Abditibacteriaceae bacterium]|nr:hypothetical protein [Abditibacteriaceae bacterium]